MSAARAVETFVESQESVARMTLCFPHLSHEILHNILIYTNPTDLSALSRTCKSLNSFLKENTMLCKEMYCLNWVGVVLLA